MRNVTSGHQTWQWDAMGIALQMEVICDNMGKSAIIRVVSSKKPRSITGESRLEKEVDLSMEATLIPGWYPLVMSNSLLSSNGHL